MNQFICSLIIFLGFGFLLCLIEFFYRKFSLSSEFIRRVSHILGALVTIGASMYLEPLYLFTILVTFSAIMLISRLLKVFNHIHAVSRTTMGEELLPLGFIAAYLIAGNNTTIFIASVLIVGIADPVTGIIMQKYSKNILGIATFVTVSLFILICYSQAPLPKAFLISIVVALVERVSSYGTDNFTIPVSTAILLLYIS